MTEVVSAAARGAGQAEAQHIVDTLIEERAPHLSTRWYWPLLRGPLRAMLHYRKACEMADTVSGFNAKQAFQHVSQILRLNVEFVGRANIPAEGGCVIVCNHPTGIGDAFAVFDALESFRPDLAFFAIADALRVCPAGEDMLIPVVWPARRRTVRSTKQTLLAAHKAIKAGRPIVIFPAGVMSRRIDDRIQDPPWERSALALARKHKLPLIPLHIEGPEAKMFHFFDRWSRELRDVTVFHELLNKTEGDFMLTAGNAIEVAALPGTAETQTDALKDFVERVLPTEPSAVFDPADQA